jgi:glycosyltransferase involved in cell wall biosynthesis
VVHDDWVTLIGAHTWLPRAAAPLLFRRTLQSASRVYAVSKGVQDWLAQDFGVASQVQLPATEAEDNVCTRARRERPFRIAYTGSFTPGPMASTALLVNVLLRDFAGHSWQLDLWGVDEKTARDQGWTDARIRAHGWGTQEQIRAALRNSDLVYLPMGFDPASRLFSIRSFPSKFTDYVASGRPVLVCAPPEACISRYIGEHACAELVDEPSPQRLAEAVRMLMDHPERREAMALRGLEAFRENHDIRRQRKAFVAELHQLIAGGAGHR